MKALDRIIDRPGFRNFCVLTVKRPLGTYSQMTRHASSEYSDGSAELVYAIDATGHIRHISEVESGSACGCRCPACEAPLVARKGDRNTHHFGHRSSFSCASGPESALHKLAKEIIATERQLFLPEVKAVFRDREDRLHAGKLVIFDSAVKEPRLLQNIIPDLCVEREGRHLVIEIYVTHACDEIKRGNLRKNGIAAVEIDLSRFPRDALRASVRDAVIERANRKWLFHPQIDTRIAEMRAAHQARENALQKRFDDEVTSYLRRYDDGLKALSARNVKPLDTTMEFFKLGLGDHIGSSVGGAGGFMVTEREWQHRVLSAFIPKDGGRASYSHLTIFEWIKEKGLLRSGFHYVRPELEKAMCERNAQFLSPYRAIEAYLDELVGRRVLRKFKYYTLSDTIFAHLTELRESVERKQERRRDLVERIEKILAVLPEEELDGFSLNDWITLAQAEGVSFAEAIEADNDSFDAMLVPVRKIEAMIFRKGAPIDDWLGLPIAVEQTRQMAARKREADEREVAKQVEAAAKEQAAKLAAEDRGEALRSFARNSGLEWISWIDLVHPQLQGMTPLASAILSEDGAFQARRLLQRLVDDQVKAQAKQAEIQHWKSELEREVVALLKQRAQPFLDSPYFLGDTGKKVKPRDYCVSKMTLEDCVKLAKAVLKSLR